MRDGTAWLVDSDRDYLSACAAQTSLVRGVSESMGRVVAARN